MPIEDEVRKMVAAVFKVNDTEINQQTRFVEDLFIKSIQVVELSAMVGYRFGLTIPLKDARNNRTVGELIDYVAGRLNAAGSSGDIGHRD